MTKQILDLGQNPNDGQGDGLRTGGDKINDNFNEIYSLLGDGENLLNTDIDFGPNKLLFSNVVETVSDLNNISASTYHGMIMHVHSTGSLYYAHSGQWRQLLTNDGNNNIVNYSDPLSTVAYSGNYNDLLNRPLVPTSFTDLSDITDGSAGQVLTTDGTGNFVFRDVVATNVEFGDVVNKPTTLAGYGIQDAFNGDYNDLTNKPVLFSGNYNDLIDKPNIPADIQDLSDTTNLLFDGNYFSLNNRPIVPSDIQQLTDTAGILFSGSYTDLTDKPTTFSGISNIQLNLGVAVEEFSNDGDLTDASQSSLVTEFAVKTYVDAKVLNAGIALDDLGVLVNSAGTANLEYNNTTGIFTYTPPDLSSYLTSVSWQDLTGTPTSIGFASGSTIDEFSIDGTLGDASTSAVPTESAVKTYVDDAIANFDSVGNFSLAASTIDTDDSSEITITPAVRMSSDLTVENDLTVNNDVTILGNLSVESFTTSGTGAAVVEAGTNLELTAGNAVVVTSSPLRLASFTTSERNLLAAQNGDLIYNTTDNKLQGYQNGSWINIDGT